MSNKPSSPQTAGRRPDDPPAQWFAPDGSVVACTEKVKVLEENWREIRALLQDAIDDAVLMGCTVAQVKSEYKRLVDALQCGYQEQVPAADKTPRASEAPQGTRRA